MPWHLYKCQCGRFYFPQRFIMIILVSFAVIVSFGQRVNISMVISAMVNRTSENKSFTECPVRLNPKNSTKTEEKSWTHFEQNALLAAFYIGYVVMHLPGGYISDKWGARHVLNLSLLISSVVTVLFPAMVLNMPFWVVCVARVVIGIAQASVFPSISGLMARWIPKSERGTMGGIAFAANSFGIILGNLVSGLAAYLADDWPPAFYIWGGAGMLWFVFAATWLYSEPDSHPFITDKEKTMLNETIRKKEKNVPLRIWQMLSDSAVWAVIFGQFGHSYLIFFLATNMPKYFKDVLQMDMKENTFASSFPYVLQWLSSVGSGKLGDYNIKKNGWNVALVRKLYTTIAMVGPSVCLVVVMYMGCDMIGPIALVCLALLAMGPYYSGTRINILDLTINFASMTMAIVNCIGALGSAINPYLIGWTAPGNTFYEWQVVVWWIFAVAIASNIIYIVWAKGDRRPWDMNEDEEAAYHAEVAAEKEKHAKLKEQRAADKIAEKQKRAAEKVAAKERRAQRKAQRAADKITAKENRAKRKEQRALDKIRYKQDAEERAKRKKIEKAAAIVRKREAKAERKAMRKAEHEADVERRKREKVDDATHRQEVKAARAERKQKKREAKAKRKQEALDRKQKEHEDEAVFKKNQKEVKQQRSQQKREISQKRKESERDRKLREKTEDQARKQSEAKTEQERRQKKRDASEARKRARQERRQKEREKDLAEKRAAQERIRGTSDAARQKQQPPQQQQQQPPRQG